MIEEFQEKQRARMTRMRSIMDYTMGIIFMVLGLYFLLYRSLGINLFPHKETNLDYFIGGLFVLYGGWRIYRGYKKDYYL